MPLGADAVFDTHLMVVEVQAAQLRRSQGRGAKPIEPPDVIEVRQEQRMTPARAVRGTGEYHGRTSTTRVVDDRLAPG
ncbi:Uncharacterised protein [Mycobacteroides abscessus subsp. abscessus]|nr:Uncharacterised protein [Mycobacteroides abscessus subsp. abscessus]